jgi:hypothetical protein
MGFVFGKFKELTVLCVPLQLHKKKPDTLAHTNVRILYKKHILNLSINGTQRGSAHHRMWRVPHMGT